MSRYRILSPGLALIAILLSGTGYQSYAQEPLTFVMAWGEQGEGPGQFNEPFDIAVGPEGFLYVTDTRNLRVQKFTSNGEFVTQWGKEGNKVGEFKGPTGLAIDQAENIYVVDWGNHRIQKFRGEDE